MPTLLLTICLLLNLNHSCESGKHRNTLRGSPLGDVTELKRLLDQVDSGDEAALRIFIRLKIANYLSKNPSAANAESVVKAAEAALLDLRAHKDEIPPLYVDLFRRELTAQLKTHAPNSNVLLGEEAAPDRRTDLEVAYSMLGQEKGVDKAVDIVQQSIAGGKDVGRIIVPFLHRLEQVGPAKVPQVLEKVIAAEEAHPGSISAGTLFTLKHLFIRERTARELQRRYLAVVMQRAGDAEANIASAVNVYTILSDVLPVIQKQAPDLYDLASARLDELARRVPRGTHERIAIQKRVSQSSDPLGQLLAESDTASDLSVKNDLQLEAAQLALEKGQVQTAIRLVAKLQPTTDETRLWRDQFIEGAVARAIGQGNIAVAKHGAGQIQSPALRSTALQKVALYLQSSDDPVSARGALNAARKLTEDSADNADKVVALLDLAVSYLKIDRQQALELTRAAVEVINKTYPVSREAELGGSEQLRKTDDMLKIAYKLIPAFQAFSAADPAAALNLAKGIQRLDLSIAATFGAHTRLPAADKNTQGVASK